MDTAITDCEYNYEYNWEVMFPITNILEATNESNFLSQRLGSFRSPHHLYK